MTTLKKDAAETATKAATGQSSALAFKTQAVLIEQDACSQHKHRSTLVVLLSWCFGVLVFWCFGVLVFWCFGVLVFWCFGVLAGSGWQ